MFQASLLACEGLSGVCLVPTVASKKMMPKSGGKQDGNRERGSSPDLLVRSGNPWLGSGSFHWGIPPLIGGGLPFNLGVYAFSLAFPTFSFFFSCFYLGVSNLIFFPALI